MNFKNIIKKAIVHLFPELQNGTHIPQLAIVAEIPDPPKKSNTHSHQRPYYAVNAHLLTPQFTIDKDMPLLQDIPVAMTGSANNRGFASLPQPGTIVEIAFAFGLQSKPFIRSVLPFGMKLPVINEKTQRWQQSGSSWQQVDQADNWIRQTTTNITDNAENIIENANSAKTENATTITENASESITENAENSIESNTKDKTENAENIFENAEEKIEYETKNMKFVIKKARTIQANTTEEKSDMEHILKSPQIWVGNEFFNSLKLESNVMQAIASALTSIATHAHVPITGPTCKSTCTSSAATITAEKVKLDLMTKL